MPEKRHHKRHKRRLTVKFGDKVLTHSGYTQDVSQGGMFLVTGQVLPLHSRLHIQLFTDATTFLFFEGEVRRQKIVPVQLRSVERGGFGVRFLHPGEVVREMMNSASGAPRFTVTFNTVDELKLAYDRELRYGGIFVASMQLVPQGSKVVVDVNLDFAMRSLELDATVVHVAAAEAAGQSAGLGVLFEDKNAAAGFQTFLNSK